MDKLQDPNNFMNRQIEMSQLSEWTDKGDGKGGKPLKGMLKAANKAVRDDKKVLNSQLDREGLIDEL